MEDKQDSIEKLLADESFVRWVKDICSKEESQKWSRWLEKDPSRDEIVKQAKKVIKIPYKFSEGPDVEEKLNQLNSEIDSYQSKKVTPVHFLYKRNKSEKFWYYSAAIVSAAACLLVAVLFYNHYETDNLSNQKKAQYEKLNTEYGEKAMLKLTDGTTITLNAKSSLRYNSLTQKGESINVWLNGEAYFEVQHNPDGKKRTFSVHTKHGDIKVLGTKFAVNARELKSEVVLEEGSVQLSINEEVQGKVITDKLIPGQMGILDKGAKMIPVHSVNTKIYTSWVHNEIILDSTPLSELVKRIESTYGVAVKVKDDRLLKQELSGSLKEDDLGMLLNGLANILNANVSIGDDVVVIRSN